MASGTGPQGQQWTIHSTGGGAQRRNPYERLLRRFHRSLGDLQAADGQGPYTSPPAFSFDPAIEAERRAAQRGLMDVAQDIKIATRRADEDKRQELHDLNVTRKRGAHDIRLRRSRGLEDISRERADVEREQARGEQDFSLRLDNLVRRYATQARSQSQDANAQGVLDESTQAASAAAREANFAYERLPLDIALGRMREDAGLAREELGIEQSRLQQDTRTDLHRLRRDYRHDTRLTEQDARRQLKDLYLRLQRAIREQRIGDVDLIMQEIFAARERRPGTFNQFGDRRHEDAGGGKNDDRRNKNKRR